MYAVFWWTAFTVAGVWAMHFHAGVDFLLPGLIVCLQERRNDAAAVLALCWILILEGLAGFSFGYAILWYGALVCLYFAGCWVFESRNYLFMILLGAAAGCLHYGLVLMMARLQDLTLHSMDRVIWESAIQAVVFPVEWLLVSKLYPKRLKDEPAI